MSELKQLPSIQKTSQWEPELGYIDYDDTNAYPVRAFGIGRRETFSAILRFFERDNDYLCGGGFDGFKVIFHLPNGNGQLRPRTPLPIVII